MTRANNKDMERGKIKAFEVKGLFLSVFFGSVIYFPITI